MRFGKTLKVAALIMVAAGVVWAATQMTASSSTIFGQATLTTSAADNSIATGNGLEMPARSFVDASGRLWVPDVSNARVLMYNSITDTKAALAISNSNDTGAAGTANATKNNLIAPQAVSYYKGTYSQFIAVNDEDRVLLWVIPRDSSLTSIFIKASTSSETLPDIVIGQASFTGADMDSALETTDSALSLAARFAQDVELAAASSGDTVYLFISCDSSLNRANRLFRFPLRDTFVTGGVETAVLSYSQSRTTTIATSFGQAPRADFLFGAITPTDTTTGTSSTKLASPGGISVYSGALYVADENNHRVVCWNGATTPLTVDTTIDAVWGQRNLISKLSWATGSETGLRLPADVVVTSGGVVISDSPLAAASARVVVFDGLTDTTVDRWFGMDATGGPVAYSAVNGNTCRAFIALGVYGSTVLAVDVEQNRILTLSSALSPSSSAAAAVDDNNCVINATLGRTGLAGIVPALRGVRDSIMTSSIGRLFVSSYYGFGLAIFMIAGAGFAYARRKV